MRMICNRRMPAVIMLFIALGTSWGSPVLADRWDLSFEYDTYSAYVSEQRARVVVRPKDDEVVRPAYLRAICQRALGLVYAEDLKSTLGAALDMTIGPDIHYADGEIEKFEYVVTANTADCSGAFVPSDPREDMLQIALRILWSGDAQLNDRLASQLLDLLVDQPSTANDAFAFAATRGDEGKLLVLVDNVIDWDLVLLDISRASVAGHLSRFGYQRRARKVLEGCENQMLCRQLSQAVQ